MHVISDCPHAKLFSVPIKEALYMPYAMFEKKTPRMGTPVLSFSKIGSISFNQTAARQLEKAGVKKVFLMWDSEGKKLALKNTSDEKDPRAYTVRYNDKGNGAGFSAKTFLDFAGIDYSQRRPMTIDIMPDKEFLVEVRIPDSCFGKME
jgi:hypothetical protein